MNPVSVLIWGTALTLVWFIAGISVGSKLTEEADVMEINTGSHPSLQPQLSDQPSVMGDVLSPEAVDSGQQSAIAGKDARPPDTRPTQESAVSSQPSADEQAWYPWLLTHAHEDGLADAVNDAEWTTGVSGELILAVLWHESVPKLMHHDAAGKVITGDGGLAIGIAQVHRDPWERHWSKETGWKFDLDDLHDNVLACALILKYYIDRHGLCIVTVAGHYNGGPYCNRHYGRMVSATERAIREHGK